MKYSNFNQKRFQIELLHNFPAFQYKTNVLDLKKLHFFVSKIFNLFKSYKKGKIILKFGISVSNNLNKVTFSDLTCLKI
jgi:hypothetical protein